MTKSILVVGDSFCAERTNSSDWPLALATHLNMNLLGFGLKGESWWFIRKKFLELYNSIQVDDIELIVFCHTEPHRIIGTEQTIQHIDEHRKTVKHYLTHLQNTEFNDWVCTQWFRELNRMLAHKKVIHIQNFDSTKNYFNELKGLKLVSPTLSEISQREFGSAFNDVLKNDTRRNHFNQATNIKFGKLLANVYKNNTNSWSNKDLKVNLNDF